MTRIKTLRRCRLFHTLSDRDLAILSHRFEDHQALPNQWIAKKGDRSIGLIILSSGKVGLDTGEGVTEDLHSYDYFGELSLVDSKKREVGAKCLAKADYLLLTPQSFQSLTSDYP